MFGITCVAPRIVLLRVSGTTICETQQVCGTITRIPPTGVWLPCVVHQQVCGTAMYGAPPGVWYLEMYGTVLCMAPPGVRSHPGVILL